MPNEQYEPDSTEDAVMTVLREHNRVNAPLVVAETDLERPAVNHALRNLATAGWCRNVARGLYEYVDDPRVSDGDESDERASTPPESGVVSHARDALAEWDPDDVNSEKARAATLAAVAWLAEEGGSHRKAAIVDALAETEAVDGYSESTLWEKVVQPGLRELVDAGVLVHRRNVGYAIGDGE